MNDSTRPRGSQLFLKIMRGIKTASTAASTAVSRNISMMGASTRQLPPCN